MSYNGTLYYFRKNLQGDVTGIYNANGTLVVEYEYTPYGALLSTTGSMATTIGAINPFRYRGYYYDTETELYYLITRYYDPEVGRFLNADAIIGANCSFVGYNSFAYCDNNPIMYMDHLGLSEAVAMEEGTKAAPFIVAAGGLALSGVILGAFVVVVLLVEAAKYDYDSPFDDDDIVPGECILVSGETIEYYTDVLTLPTTSSVVVESESSTAIAIEKEKSLVKSIPYDEPIYYGIDLRGGDWKVVTGPMKLFEAHLWVLTAPSEGFRKNTNWGLYTKHADDALIMALVLSNGNEPKNHKAHFPGQYSHYHTYMHVLYNYYQSFHVWYGNIRMF